MCEVRKYPPISGGTFEGASQQASVGQGYRGPHFDKEQDTRVYASREQAVKSLGRIGYGDPPTLTWRATWSGSWRQLAGGSRTSILSWRFAELPGSSPSP